MQGVCGSQLPENCDNKPWHLHRVYGIHRSKSTAVIRLSRLKPRSQMPGESAVTFLSPEAVRRAATGLPHAHGSLAGARPTLVCMWRMQSVQSSPTPSLPNLGNHDTSIMNKMSYFLYHQLAQLAISHYGFSDDDTNPFKRH